jgi:hypothetical protein
VMLLLIVLAGLGFQASRAEDPLPISPGDGLKPVEAGVLVSGTITSRSDDLISIGDHIFNITADTTWAYQEQPVLDVDLFDVGDIALVKAAQQGTATLALNVTLLANLVKDEGIEAVTGPPVASFSGPIEAIGSSSVTVAGTLLAYDDATVWTVAGEPTKDLTLFNPGDEVIVRGAYQGGGWVATEVNMLANTTVETPPATTTPSAQVYTGQIQALTATRLALNETTFILLDNTEWVMADGSDGSAALFEVGDTVQIIAARDGRHWDALRVTMVKEGSLS